MRTLTIDGARGEGGGQVLRTSLALAALTGTAVELKNIRAGRAKPGLMRQHLACVHAVAEVCGAHVEGAELRASRVVLTPNDIQAGAYAFKIATAGSTALLAQSVLPLLLFGATSPSTVSFVGGTHNPFAPTYHYFDEVFLRALRELGASAETAFEAWGFFPAGGGAWTLDLTPCTTLERPDWRVRGEHTTSAQVVGVNLNRDVVPHHVTALREALGHVEVQGQRPRAEGIGGALWVQCAADPVHAMFTRIVGRRTGAPSSVRDVVADYRKFVSCDAPVDVHLADQLMLPLALADGGVYRTRAVTEHARTSADIIGQFGVAEIAFEPDGDATLVRVEV